MLLTRDGQPVAAIVPLHDLRALENLDEAEDDYLSRLPVTRGERQAMKGSNRYRLRVGERSTAFTTMY